MQNINWLNWKNQKTKLERKFKTSLTLWITKRLDWKKKNHQSTK